MRARSGALSARRGRLTGCDRAAAGESVAGNNADGDLKDKDEYLASYGLNVGADEDYGGLMVRHFECMLIPGFVSLTVHSLTS